MSTTQVKQTRPWAASPMDRAMTALSVLISALTSVLIVAITPMKGKLAYFALFFIAWFIVDSLFIIRKKGVKGVRDGLAEKNHTSRSSNCFDGSLLNFMGDTFSWT